jgi:hypothetical protein
MTTTHAKRTRLLGLLRGGSLRLVLGGRMTVDYDDSRLAA